MRRARRLADQFAEELRRHHSGVLCVPFDVEGLAGALGVGISSADINQDGRLLPGRPPSIWVRSGQPRARRRFTIAHELTHWALAEGGAPAAELSQAFVSEEVLCNSVAAALLMPAAWTHQQVRAKDPWSLSTLHRISGAAEVSLSATVIRMRDLFGWRKTLLHLSHVEGKWIFDGEAGVLPSEQGMVLPSRSAKYVLNDVRNCGPGVHHCALPLNVNRAEREVPAEVLPLRKGMAVLIDSPELLVA